MNYIKRFFMNGTKTAGRVTHGIYILLRAIVTIMLVDQLIQQNMGNTFLLLLTLVLFEIRFDTAIVTKDLETIRTIEL